MFDIHIIKNIEFSRISRKLVFGVDSIIKLKVAAKEANERTYWPMFYEKSKIYASTENLFTSLITN